MIDLPCATSVDDSCHSWTLSSPRLSAFEDTREVSAPTPRCHWRIRDGVMETSLGSPGGPFQLSPLSPRSSTTGHRSKDQKAWRLINHYWGAPWRRVVSAGCCMFRGRTRRPAVVSTLSHLSHSRTHRVRVWTLQAYHGSTINLHFIPSRYRCRVVLWPRASALSLLYFFLSTHFLLPSLTFFQPHPRDHAWPTSSAYPPELSLNLYTRKRKHKATANMEMNYDAEVCSPPVRPVQHNRR